VRKTLLFGIVLLLSVTFAESDEIREGIDALLETIELSDWDAWFLQKDGEWTALPSEYLRAITSSDAFAKDGLTLGAICAYLSPLLKSSAAKVVLLMGLATIYAIANGLSDESQIGETTRTVLRIGVSGVILVLCFSEVRRTISAIETIGRTGELLLPVITGFLTLSGMENTGLLLSATHSLLSEIVLRLLETCIVPCAVAGGVLSMLDAGEGRLASVGRLLHRAAKWILGAACSLYMLVTAFRSVAAGSADGLLLKTTKFAAGSIPAIGSLLSESVDTAFQCLGFVRNALGITGCVMVVSIAAKPALSAFMTRSALRVSAHLSEPLSGKPFAELLRASGDMLHLLLLSELAAIAMTLMMIAPVFGIGKYV
jgi:hypothetical protein